MFRRTSTLLAGTVLLAASALAQAPAASAATAETGFQASAYGTQINADSAVQSGRSALAILGCTAQAGVTHTNTAASVSAPPVLASGTIDTSAASQTTASGVAATASSTIQDVSLLGGLVTASAVTSVSTTSQDSSTGTFAVTAAGTQFTGLSVAGLPVSGTPAPNTKITLPGVGYVLINQQVSHTGAHSAGLTMTGLRVVVTLSTPLAPVGTQVVVGAAASSLGGPVPGLLSGLGYGASAHVGGTVIAGELFPQPLNCLGTHGNTVTNSAASVQIPGILSSGTVTDTAEGVANARKVSGTVSSTVQNLNLLAGLVTATAVHADVTASGNPATLGDDSSFTGLAVSGAPGITDSVPPNTKVAVPGVGTLWLHRVLSTGDGGIRVVMIQLIVTVPGNPFGLTPGTQVNVASARIAVH